MSHPYHHAVSSARKWGGTPEDYLPIHDWFDESKMMYADPRHRALRHHAEGCFMCERFFGHTITLSTGRVIPVRWVAEQHVQEDLGFIPTIKDWFEKIERQPWMLRGNKINRTIELGEPEPSAELSNSVSGTSPSSPPSTLPVGPRGGNEQRP